MAILENIEDGKIYDYDICIIGSGPAGLTLCNELKDINKKICVIESGGLNKNKEIDSLKKVENIGEIKVRDSSRERIFGGTSNTWAGLSAPMDRIDMRNWPIDYSELEKYYKRLNNYGFAKYDDFELSSIKNIKDKADFNLKSENLDEKIFIAKDPAWNFGKEFKHIFDKSNIDLFINSTVININKINNKINDIEIKTIDKKLYKIKANKFIISTGGIESVRLLLISKDSNGISLGNENDQVGKYIMNHPKNNYGIIKLNKPVKNLDYLFGYLENGWAKYAGIRIDEKLQKELGVINSYLRFEPMFIWTDRKGVSDLINLTKKFNAFLIWWKNRQKGLVKLRDWNETGDDSKFKFHYSKALINILKDIYPVILYSYFRLFKNKEIKIKKIRIRNFMEMEPSENNKIILSNEKDHNDIHIPKVILNTTELDRKSLIKLHEILNDELIKKDIGKLHSNLKNEKIWPINSEASHHIGGTIMGNDPKASVVNKNLKMHSIDNLYINSSSVFPTSGCTNPTYTICALSIKLADHLKQN